MTDQPRVSLVNLPNLLTVLRLILVPVFLLALFAAGGHNPVARWVAGGIFAAAAITDRYDGHIARKRGQVTDFGKIADPIADKALIGSALVGLSLLHNIAWWITLLILVREIGITLLRLVVLRHGVIAASPGGKAKTLVQIVAIGLYVLPLYSIGVGVTAIDWVRGLLMALAIVLTVATGIDYLVRAAALVGRSRKAHKAGPA
jgi:CDP-diacylglycerol--glycerol-3-phosphate 3-phosphatidyltransferase